MCLVGGGVHLILPLVAFTSLAETGLNCYFYDYYSYTSDLFASGQAAVIRRIMINPVSHETLHHIAANRRFNLNGTWTAQVVERAAQVRTTPIQLELNWPV